MILAIFLATTSALTTRLGVDASRRSFLATSSIAFFGASLPANADDGDELSMPAVTEQSGMEQSEVSDSNSMDFHIEQPSFRLLQRQAPIFTTVLIFAF